MRNKISPHQIRSQIVNTKYDDPSSVQTLVDILRWANLQYSFVTLGQHGGMAYNLFPHPGRILLGSLTEDTNVMASGVGYLSSSYFSLRPKHEVTPISAPVQATNRVTSSSSTSSSNSSTGSGYTSLSADSVVGQHQPDAPLGPFICLGELAVQTSPEDQSAQISTDHIVAVKVDDGSVWVVSDPRPEEFHLDFLDEDGELLPESDWRPRSRLPSIPDHPTFLARIALNPSGLAISDQHPLEFRVSSSSGVLGNVGRDHPHRVVRACRSTV
ncbi:MAG: hypothetical protein M1823_003587 [Watsoniomyces obsoletus]|nr:MAG: hypothetical protein M1823_003587 [Watsoniomyces obsoletus]